ncbi:hypothetical protein DL96DRAFT_1580101 [Flagelloscypha sp. PMI_526]|nr:hypothetical protein DL96DRAFT_1580101 [Flagelloscypha sp. PMI_526]
MPRLDTSSLIILNTMAAGCRYTLSLCQPASTSALLLRARVQLSFKSEGLGLDTGSNTLVRVRHVEENHSRASPQLVSNAWATRKRDVSAKQSSRRLALRRVWEYCWSHSLSRCLRQSAITLKTRANMYSNLDIEKHDSHPQCFFSGLSTEPVVDTYSKSVGGLLEGFFIYWRVAKTPYFAVKRHQQITLP